MTEARDRLIGGPGAIAIVAGSMLGVGVFLTPRLVAAQVSGEAWFLAIWLGGGLLALAGAVAYAELGCMFPKAGGDYVYLRAAFGPSVAFASGWVLLAGVFCGSIASMSVAVCFYQLPVVLSPLVELDTGQSWWSLPGTAITVSGAQTLACGLILLLTVLNVLGIRPAAWAQVLVTLVPILLLVGFSLYGLGFHERAAADPGADSPSRPTNFGGLGIAFLNVYFAYAGWNSVAYVGGEIRRPGRNIPLGLLGGTWIVCLLYLLLCWTFARVLGMDGLAESFDAGTATARAVLGEGADFWVALVILVALFGSVNATIMGGARIVYAMAGDGILPKALGRLSHRQVPGLALWLQALLSIALVLSGSFEVLIQLTSVAMFVLAGSAVLALFRLRGRDPLRERPYRATGYPYLPGLFVVVSVVVVGLKVWEFVRGLVAGGTTRADTLPLLGLFLFAVLFLGHRLRGGRGES